MSKPPQQPRVPDTAVRVLDFAERLAQSRGFNGFSYADIAAKLGMTKASLHYHFASKTDLGCALIIRYTERFIGALRNIGQLDPGEALRSYVRLYEQVLVRDEMCLCGMFAAEFSTLPQSMQTELRRFFDLNEDWLAQLMDAGRTAGRLQFAGPALEAARTLTAGLEGAMLLARSYGEPGRFAEIAGRLLASVGVSQPSAPAKAPARRSPRDGRRTSSHRK